MKTMSIHQSCVSFRHDVLKEHHTLFTQISEFSCTNDGFEIVCLFYRPQISYLEWFQKIVK